MDFRELTQLVAETRSVRRFKSSIKVETRVLRELIELARLTPSSRNRQPLKYILINDEGARNMTFSCLSWAKALQEWGGPTESERPAAFIVILGDSQLSDNYSVDPGIVAQTIMLGAKARGLSGCILASVDRDRFREQFSIGKRYDILLALAFGVAGEKVIIEPMPDDGSHHYWRDENEVHHVPKRSVSELILKEYLKD